MIKGNSTMPLPTNKNENGIWEDKGAFRITLLQFQYYCTYFQSFNKYFTCIMFVLIIL